MGRTHLAAGLVVAALVALSVPSLAEVERPGAIRDRLTVDELSSDMSSVIGPIHNDYFMPFADAQPALHDFSGVVGFVGSDFLAGDGAFPSFWAEFITTDGYLVPVVRDIILTASGDWDIILSPGRVWSEPGDGGWSRASFPFTLVGRTWNVSRNGLATFLYNDTEISDLTLQIVQESAHWSRFDAWAHLDLIYRPGPVANADQVAAAFAAELSDRLPTAPLQALDAPDDLIAGMERDREYLTATALLSDGVLYHGPCHTRFGDYPYCDDMRHGVFSVTKSAAAALSLLWLAERYGPSVLDLEIADYVDVTADHNGWTGVTFRDAINMTTGAGSLKPDPTVEHYAESDASLAAFGNAPDARAKLDVVFAEGDYAWGPGERVRYNSMHAFVLAAAMDAYLKSVEGPDAHLWQRVSDEVLAPIGVHHAPLMHSREADGSRGIPIMGWGFFPTLDDLAKIGQLIQDRGVFEGRQLLHRDTIDALLDEGGEHGLPVALSSEAGPYRYGFSFWYGPHRGKDGCLVHIPEMHGFSDNLVMLMPNGMTAIRFADVDARARDKWDGAAMVALADNLRSICP